MPAEGSEAVTFDQLKMLHEHNPLELNGKPP